MLLQAYPERINLLNCHMIVGFEVGLEKGKGSKGKGEQWEEIV